MRNLPESAGSPISRMPQSTKGGLRPTHQPKFPEYHLFLNVLAQMNNNKSEYTIKFVDKALTYINQHTNLNEPETVKHFIAQLKDKNGEDVFNGYKKNLCLAHNKFCKYCKIKWEMPLYEPEAKTS
jgi:hypothetical protein